MKPTYTYKDISLVPRKLSEINSRDDVDLAVKVKNLKGTIEIDLALPILPSPMETIATPEMCRAFHELGLWGTLHRFDTPENRLNTYKELSDEKIFPLVSIGVGKEEFYIIDAFVELGCRYFNIDIANGFNTVIEPIIKYIREKEDKYGDMLIVAGNIASMEGFKYLSDLGVDCVRVGIGNGSVCSTSFQTSIGQGIASSVAEAANEREKINSKSMILADGGVSNPGDIGKAIALGADLVMTGSLFAGCKESGGEVIKYNNQKFKVYRGSASYATQAKTGKTPKFVEGGETLVEYKSGGIEMIVYNLSTGLKSTFSYMASRNLQEFRKNSKDSFVHYHLDKKLF